MADDTRIDNTEPATKHDVTEGGTIGAVGGAIVGALAGGPVGAIIGAVAGGAASAGAVDVVDKHDNDYDRTVGNSAAGTGAVGTYDDDYRSHYQTNYAGTGAAYDEYGPSYEYGNGLAADPRYANSDWSTVETGARSDWETRQPGTWDRIKGSVRYAYDRAKAKI